jgi:hypothetical protein
MRQHRQHPRHWWWWDSSPFVLLAICFATLGLYIASVSWAYSH